MPHPLPLPGPDTVRGVSGLLSRRCSTRSFSVDPMSLDALGQLLWAGYGIRSGGRTVPSAHALYPLDLTVVAGPLRSADSPQPVAPAVWSYQPIEHSLRHLQPGDHRAAVAHAAFADAAWLAEAPVLLVISTDLDQLTRHFVDQPQPATRGSRYAWIECGHLSQNLYLQATERGLGAVLVAGIDDDVLASVLAEHADRPRANPLGIIALGTPDNSDPTR